MAACGPGIPCTGINECCSGSINSLNTCGTSMYYCNNETQTDLCGPCNNWWCYDMDPLDVIKGSIKCQKQVNEYRDCNFTRGECINGRRVITITKHGNGGVPCPTYEICNDCEFSEWSDCSDNKKTRIITRTATNGGTCNNILTEPCNDCSGYWDDWTPCEANCDGIKSYNNGIETYKIGYRTSKYKIITPASNGISCNLNLVRYENNCYKKCTNSCTEWRECDCNTNTSSRICNGEIEIKICSDEKCNYINVFNYIINFFNIIILYIINLFK
jgi:hypothetical protein